MAWPGPSGETFFEASPSAIFFALFLNRPGPGFVESVFTFADQRFEGGVVDFFAVFFAAFFVAICLPPGRGVMQSRGPASGSYMPGFRPSAATDASTWGVAPGRYMSRR